MAAKNKKNKESYFKKYKNRYGFYWLKKNKKAKKYKWALIDGKLYKRDDIYIQKKKQFWGDRKRDYMRRTVEVIKGRKKLYVTTKLFSRPHGSSKKYRLIDENKKHQLYRKINFKDVRRGDRIRIMWQLEGGYIYDQYMIVENKKSLKFIISDMTDKLSGQYDLVSIKLKGLYLVRRNKKYKRR